MCIWCPSAPKLITAVTERVPSLPDSTDRQLPASALPDWPGPWAHPSPSSKTLGPQTPSPSPPVPSTVAPAGSLESHEGHHKEALWRLHVTGASVLDPEATQNRLLKAEQLPASPAPRNPALS